MPQKIFIFKLLLITLFISLILSCTKAQQRGLNGSNYVSSTRPALEIIVKDLAVQGSNLENLKLDGMGVVGGLGLKTYLTLYGEKEGPKVIVAHADLPLGWEWDANLEHSLAVDKRVQTIGGIPFLAQTFLSILHKDAFSDEATTQAFKDQGRDDRFIIRSFSARFNNNTSKIIIEYREKLPQGIESLKSLPLGYDHLLKDFAERAEKAFSIRPPQLTEATITRKPLPLMRLRYLDEFFFGSASPISSWPFR